jgi:hypothetical protein
MIRAVLKEIFGLFVDDEILAIGILAVVAIAGAATLAHRSGQSIAAFVLVTGLPAVLAADVVLTAGRSNRK